MRIHYNPKLKQKSGDLRNSSTLAEVLLWNELKQKKMLGYQFMRQKPVREQIVDFYYSKLHLVIEIDGESHRDQYERELARQQDLERLGFYFLRFHDHDVKKDMRNVLGAIQKWIEQYRRTTP